MRFAVDLLDANEAYKVAAYEPLELGENAAVLKYIKTIKWDNYPYSLIMVPGKGPVISGVALSPLGKTHLRIAVARWRAKQAPIILPLWRIRSSRPHHIFRGIGDEKVAHRRFRGAGERSYG